MANKSRSKRPIIPPKPKLHLELWVALRTNRQRLKQALRRVYSIARPLTKTGGGQGPWLFLVAQDPANPKTARLRKILGLKSQEDLWVELAFYPDQASMRRIIRRIWKQPKVNTLATNIDMLLSRRKPGYQATLAYAHLLQV